MEQEEVLNVFQTHYQGEPCVRIYPKGKLPNTRDVKGSNYCDIGVKVSEEDGRLVVITTIDNLVKGASGQAVQNINIMLGFPETMGLDVLPSPLKAERESRAQRVKTDWKQRMGDFSRPQFVVQESGRLKPSLPMQIVI